MGKIVGRLRQARLDYQSRVGRVVTIDEVAEAIKVSRQSLSDMENGHSLPRHTTLAKLCKYYGKEPGDLLAYEDRPARQVAAAAHLTT